MPGEVAAWKQFKDDLREVRMKAGGRSYREIHKHSDRRVSMTTLHELVRKEWVRFPEWPKVRSFLLGCGQSREEINEWFQRWQWLADDGALRASRGFESFGDLLHGPYLERDAHLDRLNAWSVASSVEASELGSVGEIGGLPGTGRTALAVRAARRLCDGSRYEDLLYLDLRDAVPSTADRLRALLFADGAKPRELQGDLQLLWRTRMARRRFVLILDNASSRDEVIDLLPRSTMVLTLVVSDRCLLGAHLPDDRFLPLSELSVEGATRLFFDLVPVSSGPPPAEKDTREFFQRTGRTALSVRLLAEARNLPGAENRTWAEIFAEGAVSVAERVQARVTALPSDRRQVLFRLAAHPGPDFDAPAAAALAGPDQVDRLEELVDCLLIDKVGETRYRIPSIIALHIQAETDPELRTEQDEAFLRLMEHYRQTLERLVRRAGCYLPRHTRPGWAHIEKPIWEVRGEALRWFSTERTNLLSCWSQAMRSCDRLRELVPVMIGLADAMTGPLRNDGPWDQALKIRREVMDLADGVDELARAVASNDIGIFCRLLGDLGPAKKAVKDAYDLFSTLPDEFRKLGQANALNEQGLIANIEERGEDAMKNLNEALDLYTEISDHIGMANSAKNLSVTHHDNGSRSDAIDFLEKARVWYQRVGRRSVGDLLGRIEVENHWGILHLKGGDLEEASDHFHEAAELLRSRLTGADSYPLEKGKAYEGIGDCQRKVRCYEAALENYEIAQNAYNGMEGPTDRRDNVREKMREVQEDFRAGRTTSPPSG